MQSQSNSANLDHLSTGELAARLGQLRLADCEPHRALLVGRVREVDPDVDPGTPTVVLLRMLGALWSPRDHMSPLVSTKPGPSEGAPSEGAAADDVAFAS